MIGNNIKKYRKMLGYSQRYLAKDLSVSPIVILMWELDILRPNEERLSKLSACLCVSVEELTKEVDFNKSNINLLKLNVFITVFCVTVFLSLWRYLPDIIPAHWSNGIAPDRYGKKAELFINLITLSILLICDVAAFFPLRSDSNKVSTYVTHSLLAFFLIGYTAIFVGIYTRYLQNIAHFVICVCASLALHISIAIHPKIFKLTGAICDTKYKITSIASYILTTVFLTVFVLSIIPII